ncbi:MULTISPECIES: 2Fe-2S iron-sulfur cluster-binding protein [Prochlorococcus]|uniref:Ferredoxin n=1 Tax=Prochlorococcus marinus (strain SARG / CCMP1375 / SS120) TaxID=167539 RepID=Q7VB40_PROMA|nr:MULTISPECIES: 2Fe-2S iron-sulfur cluster-binding protein [Prochlorococcus]AAQ00304.1 Ferredoxin [Prochlorococcus marinus subsp. marinus str. CCMP1375]KGG14116.1 Ferredoxin [Prochlorococcus marinus str. LG]KGG20716.1 Ferredoxin [Prochlorococcus marinus str. SS2]KGG25117.1 Ferredoxin [Prochlorococcus marinus str. SS35]KGG33331.1 Ferredoxin [Prochlorococcus marinus str. SS51]
MKSDTIKVNWPNGIQSKAKQGNTWLEEARKAGVSIPTGCMSGSCGACEIEVNGKVIRSCTSIVKCRDEEYVKVDYFQDPYW